MSEVHLQHVPETARASFVGHVAPTLERRHLEALLKGLKEDDPGLIQCSTVKGDCYTGAVRHACAIGYCGWKAGACKTTLDVYAFFDARTGGYGSDDFVAWYDNTPREEMRRGLIPLVEEVLQGR